MSELFFALDSSSWSVEEHNVVNGFFDRMHSRSGWAVETRSNDVMKDLIFWVVDVKVFPVYWIGFFLVLPSFVFDIRWLLWVCIPILLTYFFYTPLWFSLMFRLGLRKAGFKGKIVFLKQSDLIERLMR